MSKEAPAVGVEESLKKCSPPRPIRALVTFLGRADDFIGLRLQRLARPHFQPARMLVGHERAFYITTAIPYANGAPHIGHAYECIATDAIQRFMRLDGRFVTGMDEHGLKMQQTAAREGLTPQALADRTATLFAAMGEALEAQADEIVRTTEERHKRANGSRRRALLQALFYADRRGFLRHSPPSPSTHASPRHEPIPGSSRRTINRGRSFRAIKEPWAWRKCYSK